MDMQEMKKSGYNLIWLCFVVAGVIFLIDIAIPLGVAAGVPYILVVLISLYIPQRNIILYIAVLCSILTLLGYFTSPIGGEYWKVIANRSLALFAIWSVALLGLARRKSLDALKEAHDHLEERVERRTKELTDEVAVRRRTEEALRASEESLQKAHDGLERKVEERTVELKGSLAEKEVLLKEIHHRVKNNLQVITSILSLQSRYIDDEAMKEVFRESQNRIQSMAMIHEKLYQSSDLANIDFADYIKNLTTSIFSSYKLRGAPVSLSIDIVEVVFDIDTCVCLGLIINELCTNSLKYAFNESGGGEISIELKGCKGERCVLIVKDNGVGLPKGFKIEETGSMGHQLVDSLVVQLGGELKVLDVDGACFEITFPC